MDGTKKRVTFDDDDEIAQNETAPPVEPEEIAENEDEEEDEEEVEETVSVIN
jgi:hypothetical protein